MATSTYKQDNRLMQLTTPLGDNVLLPQKIEGHDAISELFEYQLTCFALASQDPIDPANLVGKEVTVTFAASNMSNGAARYIHALVASMEMSAGDEDFDVYELRLVPKLWQLTLGTNCRVFQGRTPIEIINRIARQYGISISNRTSEDHRSDVDVTTPMPYCTQYNETDFAFICRVAEWAGIFFRFEHTKEQCFVVFGSDSGGYATNKYKLPYSPQAKDVEGTQRGLVSRFTRSNIMRTGEYGGRYSDASSPDFSPKELDEEDSNQTAGMNKFEHYTYPLERLRVYPGWVELESLKDELKLRRRASDIRTLIWSGSSNASWLSVADTLTLTSHPRAKWNADYVLIRTTLSASQSPAYRSGNKAESAAADEGVKVTFSAVAPNIAFIPESRTPRPRIYGPQTAIVAKPWNDKSGVIVNDPGRVFVNFMWQRPSGIQEYEYENSGCFVRVAQQWAGYHRGAFFWPRLGDEVVVAFLDGDPDKPVVIGSVYNEQNPLILDPKAADHSSDIQDNYTRSGWITRSIDGSDKNASEFWIEDKKGHEEVHLHAERNLNINVEAGSTRMVGGDETIAIWGDQATHHKKKVVRTIQEDLSEKVFGDVDRRIMGVRNEKVDGDSGSRVKGNMWQSVTGSSHTVVIGQLVLHSNKNIIMEGADGIQLTCGKNFIQVTTDGVTIVGNMVNINSGGAAQSWEPAQVPPPTVVDPPDWMHPDPSKLEGAS